MGAGGSVASGVGEFVGGDGEKVSWLDVLGKVCGDGGSKMGEEDS